MNARLFISIGLSILVSGCGRDISIGIINHDPEAQITSHADGSEVVEGELITLVGKASDIDTPMDVLASWYTGGLELCPPTAPDELGAARCETALGPGEQVITLEVQDPSNIAGRDSITMFGVANEPPDVLLSTPRADEAYYSDELITFEATVSDKEDTAEQMTVSWENQDGDLNMTVTPLSNGQAISSMSLEEGEHQLTVFVTDSGNKVGTDTTTITVGPPNSSPTCGITGPPSGDSSEEGSQVAFAGSALDADVEANLLSVEWSSDKDGVLGNSTPNSSGDVAFLTSALNADTHTITMTVTDEIGATCSDFITHVVGTAPTVLISSPVSGGIYIFGEVVKFEAQVGDMEDLATDLFLDWFSDLDGVVSNQGADSSGVAGFSMDTLSLGQHVLTLTARDTSGIGAQALVNFQVVENSAPSVGAVTVSPDPVYIGDSLSCSYSGYYDADGHPDLSGYSWKINGSNAGGTNTLSSGFVKGDTVKCVVTPSDGIDDGTNVNASLVVSNTLPSISTVSISPAAPTLDDTLTCSYAGFDDADSDSDSSTAEWFVAGTSVGAGASLSGAFSGGDEVSCTVTPNDGEGVGTPLTAQITIENTAPSVSSVSLSPSPAVSTDLLSCSYSGYSDPDGDSDKSRYEWSVNGTLVSTGNTVLQGVFGRSDEVICSVIPSDGMDDGSPVTALLVITNQSPEATVFLTPTTVYTDEVITAIATGSDVDGDPVTLSYVWKVNGVAVAETGDTLDGSTYFDRDDEVKVRVTPNDGQDDGSTVTSSTITIENTAPSVSNPLIDPAAPTAADTLSCSHDFDDLDNDTDVSVVEWAVNSVVVSDPNVVAVRGDTLDCTVTADDGTDQGNTVTTSAVIGNQPPSITSVSISPDPASGADILTCSYGGYSDPDGDADQSRYEWMVNGSIVSVGSPTLQGLFVRADVVDCTVIPADGADDGSPISASLTVENEAPEATASLTPSVVYTDGVLTAVTTSSDLDGDPVSLSYVWRVNGVAVAETGTSLDGDTYFDRDDEVKVKITPNDGVDDGVTVTSSVITIQNTAPSVSSAAISPATPTAADTLSCGYSYTDIDPDLDVSTVEWTVNSLVVSDPAGMFVRGDTVGCTVTANDGTDVGNIASASVVIGNQLPIVSAVTIDPNPANSADTLNCSYSFEDVDGDQDQSTILWQVNGSNAGYTSTLTSGFMLNDTVSCTVTPNDGSGSGTAETDSLVIGNTPPVVTSVSIDPDPAGMNDDLSCLYTATDLDGDSIQVTYSWTVNGNISGSAADLSGPFNRFDVVECTVTPDDSSDIGAPVSGGLTIGNTAPSITSVSISPDPGTSADTLTCNYVFDDVDGDSDAGSTISWTVEGMAAGSGATLAGAFVAGETVACEVTPDDGVDMGAPMSGSLVVNTAPVVSNVAISPDPAIETDDLTCNYTFSDADGHLDASSISWTVDTNPAGVGDTLVASAFSTGSDVSCFVTANDGSEDGNSESASIFINGPPTISDVSISPNPATASDSLDCTYTYVDPESDPDQSTVVWSLNGVEAYTGTTLSTGFIAGDLVDCTVNGADAYSSGNSDSDSLTINTPPSVASAALSPDPIAVGDDVDCVYTFEDPDPLDLDQSDIEWFIDGASFATGSSLSTSFVGGETVWCEVTPFDGAEYGPLVQSPSLRVNQMPTVSNVQISPDPAFGDVDLSCSYTYDDPDFDIDQSLIEWRVNGFAVGSDPVLPLYEIDEGDDVVCEVTPYDGINYGSPLSDSLQVSYTEREHCGVISQDETWEAYAPHLVTCDVLVEGLGAPTLTIEDGAVVRFESGHLLASGQYNDGRIVVDGHTQGVEFLSDQVNPLPGAWGGVRFFAMDQGSSLTGVTISHAGGTNVGSVFIQSASPTLDGLTIIDGDDHGIEVIGSGAFPLIKNTVIQDNADMGVYISGLNGLDSTVSPSFTNNTITGNLGEAMMLPPAAVGQLSPTGSYAGNGAPITIKNYDKIEASATWYNLDEDYVSETDLNVRHPSGPVLTLEDGVTLRFALGKDLVVGQTDPGTLIADGSTLGILLTTKEEFPTSADYWRGVRFYGYDGGSVLNNVTVEYGGYGGTIGNIYVDSASPTLDGVISRDSLRDGIRIRNSSAKPLIQNSQFLDNDESGVWCEAEGGLADGGGTASFVNNVMSGNSGWAINLFANDVGQLDPSSSFTGNGDDIRIDGGQVEKDAVWQLLDVDYFVEQSFRVDDVSGPVLTIDDGVTLLMDTSTEIQIGKYNDGMLVVDGHTLGVSFTSAAEVPVPGDWYGVLFDDDDIGSLIDGLDISYGGQTTTQGQLKLVSSSPTFINTTSRLSAGDGLWMTGSSFPTVQSSTFSDNWGSGLYLNTPGGLSTTYTNPTSGLTERSFQGNLVTGNNDYAMELAADSVNQLHSSNTISGNDDGIKILDGNVTLEASWIPFDEAYIASQYIRVQGPSSPMLTIEDGVEIRFALNMEMVVGYGDEGGLIVDGHTLGVLMTSDEAAPAPGDWHGLKLFGQTMDSTLLGLTVEYAGGGASNESGIYVYNATVAMDSCVVRDCLGRGLYAAYGSILTVTNTELSGNDEVGLQMATSGDLVGFSGNTVTNNGAGALILNPGELELLDSSSVLVPNDDEVIFVSNGTISQDTTWRDLGARYQVDYGDIKVSDSFGPTLTIEDGVEVYWGSGTELEVGYPSSGKVIIEGDVNGIYDWDGLGYGSGVYFTSDEMSPSAGDWRGILIGQYDLGSEIIGLTMEYGGIAGSGGIHATFASPEIGYSSVSDVEGSGITGTGTATLNIHHTTIANAAEIGVNLSQASSGLVKGTSPSFVYNDIYGCGGAPIELGADFVGQLDATSSYDGNGDYILVKHGDVTTDAVWQKLDTDLEIATTIRVQGISAPVLTIEDGVTAYFGSGHGLEVGTSEAGSLVTEGTGAGVVFTSAAAFPSAGDWYGVEIRSYDQGSVLNGLDIEYGGTNYDPGLLVHDASPVLDGVQLRYSGYQGIRVEGAASAPSITNTTIENSNNEGLYIHSASSLAVAGVPSLSGNTFSMNGKAGISVPAHLAHEIDDSNFFSGNTPDILLSSGGELLEQVTWLKQDVPYTVGVDIDIAGVAGAMLTLKDGVELAFEAGRKIFVGSGPTGTGALMVEGDIDGILDWDGGGYGPGVVFTAAVPSPGSSDYWGGVEFYEDDAGSELTGLLIEYAGLSHQQAALSISDAAPLLDGVTIQYSETTALLTVGTAPGPLVIQRSQFLDNLGDGLSFSHLAGPDMSTGPSFTDNVVSGNAGYTMQIYAAHVGALDVSSSYIGNSYPVRVLPDEVEEDAVWQKIDADYLIKGTVDVRHPTDPVLTISDGITMYFEYDGMFRSGNGAVPGQMIIDGHTDGVLFTSDKTSPVAGDFSGIVIGSSDSGSFIDGLTLEYGARAINGAITSYSSLATVQNSTITDSEDWGIYCNSGAQLTLSNISYANNTDGDLYMP